MAERASTRRRVDPLNAFLAVVGVLTFVFLFLPILVIVIYSFNTRRLFTSWDGFGFSAYESGFENPTIRDSLIVSLKSAVGASLLATALGSIAGVALARRPGKWSVAFVGLLALTMITPEIVDAVALLPWLVSLGTDQGLTIFNDGIVRLVVGHSLFATAVVCFIVRARMAGIDESLEEAAADLYATPLRRFTQITLPLMAPAVLAGALMSFTLSLDNTVISAFVQVSGSTPWPVYILSSMRSTLRPQIAAVSTVMLLLTLLVLLIVVLVLRRSGDSSADIAKTMAGP